MVVRVWGARGSIAVSGPQFVRTGGNTSCFEVEHVGARLILDGGTGLRALGDHLGFQPVEATLLFSHLHWDHIQGVPFFLPAWHPGSRLCFAGATRGGTGLRNMLSAQMRPPAFPVTLDAMPAARRFVELRSGEPLEVGPFRVTPLDLPHPGGSLAFRVEAGGRALVYATDVELAGAVPAGFAALCSGASLLLHDAQYTAPELGGKRGWGHSAWEEAVFAAAEAGVSRLGLIHHDPARDDDAVAVIEARAQERLPGAFAAREGATLGV